MNCFFLVRGGLGCKSLVFGVIERLGKVFYFGVLCVFVVVNVRLLIYRYGRRRWVLFLVLIFVLFGRSGRLLGMDFGFS